jgi:Zn ribbon nucleic-acid-binding protein
MATAMCTKRATCPQCGRQATITVIRADNEDDVEGNRDSRFEVTLRCSGHCRPTLEQISEILRAMSPS